LQAAREVVRKKLSVRETENLVRRLARSGRKKGSRRPDPDILSLQNHIGEVLGTRVRIQHLASGKGKLVIAYNNSEEFEGILDRLHLNP
jgi:ParB family chromosome partitioning protein